MMLGFMGCCKKRNVAAEQANNDCDKMASQNNAHFHTKNTMISFKPAQPTLRRWSSAPGDLGLGDKAKSNSSLDGLQTMQSVVEPAYEKAEASKEELSFDPQTVGQWQPLGSGEPKIVKYRVGARALTSGDRKIVSPHFTLESNQGYEHVFKLQLTARQGKNVDKDVGFNVAKGCGTISVMLKDECPASESFLVGYRLSVGSGVPGPKSKESPTRQSVRHDFSENSVANLDKDAIWNFKDVVDTDTNTFLVCLVVWQLQ